MLYFLYNFSCVPDLVDDNAACIECHSVRCNNIVYVQYSPQDVESRLPGQDICLFFRTTMSKYCAENSPPLHAELHQFNPFRNLTPLF